MYIWKCWRETRYRFIVFLALNFVCLLAFAKVIFAHGVMGLYPQPHKLMPLEVRFLLPQYLFGILSCFSLTAIAAAFVLGSTSVGGELENGTAEYLWTRPQKRSSFVWWHSFVCAVEILSLVEIPSLLVFLFFGIRFGIWEDWYLLILAPICAVVASLFLGLTVFMTAIRKSSVSGLIFSLGVMFAYIGTAFYFDSYTKIRIPEFTFPFLKWSAFFLEPSGFPWWAFTRIAIVSLLFILFAQKLMNRAEV